MNDDVRKTIYRTLTLFVIGVVVWIIFLFLNACGFSLACKKAAAPVDRTPVPTLIPATMPAPTSFVLANGESPAATEAAVEGGIPHPSNPGGSGEAITLKGDAAAGEQLFATNCTACHGDKGMSGIANPGSKVGTVPTLNPINPLLKDSDYKTFAANIDLFIQHGSKPAGTNPTFQMPAWGDLKLLQQQQIADIMAYLISLNK